MLCLLMMLAGAIAADDVNTDEESDTGDASDDADDDVIEVLDRKPWRTRSRNVGTGATAGSWTMGGGDIEQVAGAGGDVTRALQALPVVHTATVRSTALSIRGSAPQETIWVVEGVPLLAPRSSGTIFSRIPTPLIEGLTLHAASQPVHLPGAIGGIVEVGLIEPADDQWDGTIELTPVMGQALVSVPLGPRGQGNAMAVSVRRSWLEPVFGALGRVGADPGWRFSTEDVALKLRLQPGASHRLGMTLLAGRTRVAGTLGDGAEVEPTDNTHTVLAVMRHRWTLGRQLRLDHQLSWTHERQDIDQSPDVRQDTRTQPAYRARLIGKVGSDFDLEAGAGVGVFGMQGGGRAQDPTFAYEWLQVPWRADNPPIRSFRTQAAWLETSQWASVTASTVEGLVFGASLRFEQVQPGPTTPPQWGSSRFSALSPQVRLSAVPWKDGQLSLALGTVHQGARDPVLLDVVSLTEDHRLSRRTYAGITLDQPLVEGLRFRGDVQISIADRLPVLDVRSEGSLSLIGEDVSLSGNAGLYGAAGRWRWLAAVSGLIVRRDADYADRGPQDLWIRPWFAPRWTTRTAVSADVGPKERWNLGAQLQVRAGVWQPTLTAEPFNVGLLPTLDNQYLPANVRVGSRVERTFILNNQAKISVWGELLLTAGPLWQGIQTNEDGSQEVVMRRDRPAVPWLGARARF
ncbi:MAG: hypothetical protein AB8H79_00125 [Myxococcota bacterium]